MKYIFALEGRTISELLLGKQLFFIQNTKVFVQTRSFSHNFFTVSRLIFSSEILIIIKIL